MGQDIFGGGDARAITRAWSASPVGNSHSGHVYTHLYGTLPQISTDTTRRAFRTPRRIAESMPLAEDNDVIKKVSPDRSDEPLGAPTVDP